MSEHVSQAKIFDSDEKVEINLLPKLFLFNEKYC